VLAEGAPAETFVDCNSRVLFDNAAEFAARYPGAVTPPAPRFCAPRITEGPVLVRLLRRLHGLAGIVHGPLGGPTGGPTGGHLPLWRSACLLDRAHRVRQPSVGPRPDRRPGDVRTI